ncbi:hypothetical protein [Alteromonas lipolytica]|uniref:Thioredoxin domain-containing protein n=1 Tax=Alteromonas lipolytica TaxID=1856405 RepID=A0A1E8FAV0_9ALTE|nr:hypothetical protein [Alteromonas lipolytica]OFI33041.1 hypothetical protein BFC17_01845 [Alteromonas lipolytica]GGF63081.1 hypothetical protein GCM10011338_14380 [Alteromonas lipolytica]
MATAIETQSKPKRALLVLLAAFIVPVILARLALDFSWFEQAATNKGELLQPVENVQPLLADQTPKWRVMYIVPATCNSECENAIYAMQQVWLALGKESDRAQPAVFLSAASDPKAMAILHEYQHINAVSLTREQMQALTESQLNGHLFLVDTQGSAMLRYPLYNLRQDAVMGSRDVLADLRKLLKLSRIG